jgi:hypothetical protein
MEAALPPASLGPTLEVKIPMRLPSAANLREHWRARHRRVKAQRATVAAFLGGRPRPSLPAVVTLTRVSPRPLDGDNLQGAFKGVRDQVAAWFGIDDASSWVTWAYAQRRGAVGEYGIELRFEPVGGRL